MKAGLMLSVPAFSRYTQTKFKSQLRIACRKRASAQPLAAERPVKSLKKLMNIERSTSNIKVMNSVYLIFLTGSTKLR